MDSAQGSDYFEWSFFIKFQGEIDTTAVQVLQDYGAEIVHETDDTVYFE